MSDQRQKYLCDAVATVDGGKLFITIFQVGSGIEFSSGRGETKYGSPRRYWTEANIRQEIAFVYGAKSVELKHPEASAGSAAMAR